MRQLIFVIVSLTTATTLLTACGTKGPLTLPPKTTTVAPTSTATTPAPDVNTVAGQR